MAQIVREVPHPFQPVYRLIGTGSKYYDGYELGDTLPKAERKFAEINRRRNLLGMPSFPLESMPKPHAVRKS